MKTKIEVLETVTGYLPQEQIEFLSLTFGGMTKHIAAYNKGNGYIKLFTYQNFLDFFCYGACAESEDITLDLYNSDEDFEDFVTKTYFSNQTV